MLEHAFTGPEFTVGIEEELMILDPEDWTLSPSIERLLAAMPAELCDQVHPELHQSVLELATSPCEGVGAAGKELAELRRAVIATAAGEGLAIGAAATHPFASANEQVTTDKPRYRELIDELGIIALREVIFGTHVHVAIQDPDRAIYVADGIRRYLPLFLALSVNSPFWEGERTGLMSSRVPVFRSFPRQGIPPHYGTWEIYSHRVGQMMRAGAISDYTFMWWDVRTHARLGTVETRVFDQQTRIEDTVALAALNVSLAHRLCALYDAGEPLIEYPTELIDDNKIRAARHGIEGKLVDFRAGAQVEAVEMAHELVELLAPDADALGCGVELAGIDGILERGTGAQRQLAIWEETGDLAQLTAEIAEHTKP